MRTTFFKPLGRYLLKRSADRKNRSAASVKLATANSIGIVYAFHDDASLQLIRQYAEKLRKEGFREVRLLIYFPTKKKAAGHAEGRNEIFYNGNETNWLGAPSTDRAKDFCSKRFDVLMDFSEGVFALDYLVAKSDAVWKIGRAASDRTFLHDMLIKTGKNPDLHFVVEQVDFYMRMMAHG